MNARSPPPRSPASPPTSPPGNYGREPAPGSTVFNFEKDAEEESFELVDTKPVKKPGGFGMRGRGGPAWGGRGGRDGGRGAPVEPGGRGGFGGRGGPGGRDGGRGGWGGPGGRGGPPGRGGWGGRGGGRFGWQDQQRPTLEPSLDVGADWAVLGDNIPFSALAKLATTQPAAEDLLLAGAPAAYDRAADRVTPKAPAKLAPPGPPARAPAASDDPLLRRLAAEGAAEVFTTDTVLAALMCATRSVSPWHVLVHRRGGALWLDAEPHGPLGTITSGETAPDPPEEKEGVNAPAALALEATAVHAAFRAQVLAAGGAPPAGAEPLPPELAAAGAPPPALRYRRWALGGTRLVARCAVDGAVRPAAGSAAEPQTVAVHALNEFDPKWSGVDWRARLENQRGAVLATELKNNAAKVARWTAAALFSGVDLLKLGYVSRATWKSAKAHVLLGTQAVKPKDFAAQMNLSMEAGWGAVRALVELCAAKCVEEGAYVLIRDPNKPQLRLYAVPAAGAGGGGAGGEGAGGLGGGGADEDEE